MKGDHPGEADPAGPQHRGERHVADRADEAEDRHHRSDDRVLDELHARRRVGDEQAVEEAVGQLADEPGEQEADRDLLPQHRPVVAEVMRDVRPRCGGSQPLTDRHRLARHVVLVAGVRRPGVLPRLLLEAFRDEQPQQHGHRDDQDQSANELGERELPADQHPEDDPQLEDEVGGGELEGQRRGRRGALLKQALGRSRSRRSCMG